MCPEGRVSSLNKSNPTNLQGHWCHSTTSLQVQGVNGMNPTLGKGVVAQEPFMDKGVHNTTLHGQWSHDRNHAWPMLGVSETL